MRETFTAQRWNGWLDRLGANTILGGRTSRVRRLSHGQALDLFAPQVGWRHPWWVDTRWNVDHWEAQIARPGLVNGLDPVLQGVKSQVAGQEAEEATLLEYPWIALHGYRSGLGAESGAVKAFFRALGVRDAAEEFRVDVQAGTVTQTAAEEPGLPERQLLACDLYLAKARATFRAQVSAVDPSGASGRAVDYSVTYDTTQLDAKGTRPRVLQAPIFPPVHRPTLADRLFGNYQDEGEDRRNICSVYFLSPPSFDGPLDGSWTPYVRHDLFWNLRHGARVTPPKTPPRPIRFHSGLAGGFGDLLINQWLALDDALTGQILNAVVNTAPEGQFSIA